jgi:hypothetical protein
MISSTTSTQGTREVAMPVRAQLPDPHGPGRRARQDDAEKIRVAIERMVAAQKEQAAAIIEGLARVVGAVERLTIALADVAKQQQGDRIDSSGGSPVGEET